MSLGYLISSANLRVKSPACSPPVFPSSGKAPPLPSAQTAGAGNLQPLLILLLLYHPWIIHDQDLLFLLAKQPESSQLSSPTCTTQALSQLTWPPWRLSIQSCFPLTPPAQGWFPTWHQSHVLKTSDFPASFNLPCSSIPHWIRSKHLTSVPHWSDPLFLFKFSSHFYSLFLVNFPVATLASI
jgi:hypothetical protein